MDLFKKYHYIMPYDYPVEWLLEQDPNSERYFKEFLKYDEKLNLPELEKIKTLLKKNSVQAFLNYVFNREDYKFVNSMTIEEVNNIPDLSSKELKTKFFGLVKNRDVMIQVQGKKMIPTPLKQLYKIASLKEIKLLSISKIVMPDAEYVQACKSCDGKGGKTITVAKTYYANPRPMHGSFPLWGTDNGIMQNDFIRQWQDYESSRTVSMVDKKITCSECKGKGLIGFSFKDFKKYIQKFNEYVDVINKEILDLNEKSIKLVEEYNDTIEELNKKIRIWNSKCPSKQ